MLEDCKNKLYFDCSLEIIAKLLCADHSLHYEMIANNGYSYLSHLIIKNREFIDQMVSHPFLKFVDN